MNIIARNDWCTTPPRSTPTRIADRQPRAWLHHGATGSSTIATANSYARYHIKTHGWTDIGYSFVIAEGKVLEGRGVGRQGAHTQGDNASSYGICLAGDYSSRPPSDRDLDALVWLVRHGHAKGWWPKLTGGHRDAPGASTSCPGSGAYRLIGDVNRRAAQAPQEGFLMALTDEQQKQLYDKVMRTNTANGEMAPQIAEIHRQLTDREAHTVARKAFTMSTALGSFLKGGAEVNVDVDELAAALSETLGDDVAQAVGQRLVQK